MKKPNIILITTDQQRFDTIQALGNPVIYTPHLNWLTDEGVTYTRTYAECPICVASRTSIMTGMRGYVSGISRNCDHSALMESVKTLPQLLTENGYQTRAIGKMHFHPARANYGFEHMELPLDYYRMMQRNYEQGVSKMHGVGENEVEPVLSTVDENHSLTHWTVDRSVDFLETRDERRPFFLWTSFSKPHPPLDPCPNYWNLYETDDMPDPVYGDWSKDFEIMPKGFLQSTFMLNNIHRLSPKQQRAVKRAYYACITQIDYSLGFLFSRLRELNLMDNTYIIFTSDHGDMMGDHHMGAKMTFLEGSAHVPLIIKAPDQSELYKKTKGLRCDNIEELSYLYHTILSIAGISNPSEQTEKVDLTKDFEVKVNREFYGFCQDATNTYSVMDGQYKYLYTEAFGQELLFDLQNDPMEQVNLAAQPDFQPIVSTFRSKLSQWALQYHPELILPTGEFQVTAGAEQAEKSRKWPGYHSIRFEGADVLH